MKEYDYNILENANEATMMFADDADSIEDRARFVRIVYKDGHRKELNISCDSYAAIVHDIFKHI